MQSFILRSVRWNALL